MNVPIVIRGKRKNGTKYEIKSHMKMEKLGVRPVDVPLNLTLDQRRDYIKRAVEAAVPTDKPLYQVSDEEWWYDPHGTWAIHEETVGVDPDSGKPEAHVILDRRTRAPEALVSNTLLYPEALCEEALDRKSTRLNSSHT